MVFQLKKAVFPPHPLKIFEIKDYYENEARFNGVYSRDNLPKIIKNGAYVINLDEYADVGTHRIALYVKNNEVIYFYNFGVQHVPEEIKRFIGHKNTKPNIFRIQADNSIMCGYFCIGFIDFMFAGKSLINFTSLFSPYDFKKNDKNILIILNELIINISHFLKRNNSSFKYLVLLNQQVDDLSQRILGLVFRSNNSIKKSA